MRNGHFNYYILYEAASPWSGTLQITLEHLTAISLSKRERLQIQSMPIFSKSYLCGAVERGPEPFVFYIYHGSRPWKTFLVIPFFFTETKPCCHANDVAGTAIAMQRRT